MSTKPWPWKPRDISRALGVARKNGLDVTGYAIGADGTITVMTGTSAASTSDGNQSPNPWDTSHAADQKRTA
jgi:hypothetical protein